MIELIFNYINKQIKIRKLVQELSAYSDRELNDIGISRCDIEFVVRKNLDEKF